MNTNKNKKPRRRGPRGWTRPGFGSLVTKQQVKNMIESKMDKVQDKYLISAIFNGSVVASTGTLVQPALPAQGTANGQREADSLALDVIQANFTINNVADSTTITATSDSIRLICVQARANTVLTISNAAVPTTGVLDNGVSGAAVDINSFVNLNAANELFHVLHDQTYSVNYLSSNASRGLHLNLRPAVSKINFSPGTTTSLCGGISWIALSIQDTSAQITLVQRLVYHDL